MHYTDHRTQHPEPLDQRKPLPCGCHCERRAYDNASWCYVYYAKVGCTHGVKVGRREFGEVWMPMDASEADVRRAMEETRR